MATQRSPLGFPGDARELRLYIELLRINTPPATVLEMYSGLARGFVYDCSSFVRANRGENPRGVSLRKSALFGVSYAVAFLDERAFTPGLDAACWPTYNTFPYPVIVIPWASARNSSRAFRSVLEHEMVHANQALCGRFPIGYTASSAEEAAQQVFEVARAEYEANFLQLGYCPALFMRHHDASLQRWCLFRGWTAALERLFEGHFCAANLIPEALSILQDGVVPFMLGLGSLDEDAEWFALHRSGIVASVRGDVSSQAQLAE